MFNRTSIILLLLGLIGIGGYLLADWVSAKPENIQTHYVGRQSCITCHQTQATLFHGSDHDLAMDWATDESVLANFNDQQIEHHGLTSRMFRDGKKFMVRTDGPTGEMEDFEVKFVFGVRPLQQYMVELERPADAKSNEFGRVQVLRISWDTMKNEWFYLNPPDVSDKLEPDDPLHWTGITQNWNASCATCHSTDLKKNFNPLAREYHTTFSEIDVSCEACHGPGSLHVELANERSLFWDRRYQYGLAKLKTTSNLPQIETCAPCHSRRSPVGEGFRPGCNFDDYFATQLLVTPIYHADGQVRDEDYVYGSFIQSKMFHTGIRCTDCHDPHSLKVKFTGNLLCTSCHQHPAGKYDSPSHHHHAVGTPGASCVECHMPETTYMSVDARRDHSLRVPRPDLSVRFGTPNACTGCHLDANKLTDQKQRKPLTQYLDWIIAGETGDQEIQAELKRVDQAMLEATQKWYPADQSLPLTEYYEQLTIAQADSVERLPVSKDLAVNLKNPAIVRATALELLANESDEETLTTALAALGDANVKVVAAALVRVQNELNTSREPQTLVSSISKLLKHTSPRVRIEAARVLAMLPPTARQSWLDPEQRRAFDLQLDEYKKSLYADSDHAGVHMMLGGLHETEGDRDRAKDDYRTAMAVEPNLAGPRSNLAALLEADLEDMSNQMRNTQQGGGVTAQNLRGMIERMDGLQKQVMKLRAEEHQLLAKDIERSRGLANTSGLHYRFAMSSYLQGDLAATEKHLLAAHREEPESPAFLLGLATYYIQIKQPKIAQPYIKTLIKQNPQNQGYQALNSQVQQMLKADND